MSTKKYNTIFEMMALSSLLVILDIIIASVSAVIVIQSIFPIVSNLLLVEFSLLLIIGACMMSRQPMTEEKEKTETGERSQAFMMYLLGRKLLGASVFAFLFSLLFAFIP